MWSILGRGVFTVAILLFAPTSLVHADYPAYVVWFVSLGPPSGHVCQIEPYADTSELPDTAETRARKCVDLGFQFSPSFCSQAGSTLIDLAHEDRGYKYHCSGYLYCKKDHSGTLQRAPDGSYICKTRQYRIAVSAGVGSSFNHVLTDMEPGQTASLNVSVYDQNNRLVPNIDVKLEVTVKENSGGHQHHGERPEGELIGAGMNGIDKSIFIGNVGTGNLAVNFIAPLVAGDHTIVASCINASCTQQGPDTVRVGIEGLEPLRDSPVYILIGDLPNHFDNHYLTPEALYRITVLAALYHGSFPGNPLLHLNDASLERGGIFDIGSNWKPPHFEHCRGTEIDIRGNDALGAIPSTPEHQERFQFIAGKVGAYSKFETPKDKNKKPAPSLRHYHVRLLGGIPQCP